MRHSPPELIKTRVGLAKWGPGDLKSFRVTSESPIGPMMHAVKGLVVQQGTPPMSQGEMCWVSISKSGGWG